LKIFIVQQVSLIASTLIDLNTLSTAIECSPHGTTPHRFQSAVWFTLAGRMTFTDELERYILPVRFRLLPNDAVLATTLEELVVRVFFCGAEGGVFVIELLIVLFLIE
jgi:hypothetical protein